jgi:hypothetical protein
MIIKANGRSALILATGLFVCFAGPSQAATTDDASAAPESAAPLALNKYTKHSAHHRRSFAHHRSSKLAQKSTDKKDASADVAADSSNNSPAIPPEVANANAEMASGDVPGGNAKAMSARANDIVQAGPANPAPATTQVAAAQPTADSQVVAADQLNDVDRALHEGSPPAATVAMASADTPAAPAAPVMASSNGGDNSTWDQTSLIGKIFIGFGALLTMASAARMFMA